MRIEIKLFREVRSMHFLAVFKAQKQLAVPKWTCYKISVSVLLRSVLICNIFSIHIVVLWFVVALNLIQRIPLKRSGAPMTK
jgi:hypothetical protein